MFVRLKLEVNVASDEDLPKDDVEDADLPVNRDCLSRPENSVKICVSYLSHCELF